MGGPARREPPLPPKKPLGGRVLVDEAVTLPHRPGDIGRGPLGGVDEDLVFVVGHEILVDPVGRELRRLARLSLEPLFLPRDGTFVEGLVQLVAVFPLLGSGSP